MRTLLAACLCMACTTATPLLPGLQERLDRAAAGTEVDLGPGVIAGDVIVRRPVVIRGAPNGATTITGKTAFTITVAGVRLESLHIVASEVGVHVGPAGGVGLRDVRLEGAPIGVAVDSTGSAVIEDSSVRCESKGVGVHVEKGSLRAARLSIDGGCRRGVEINAGVAELHRLWLRSAQAAAIHAVDAKLLLSDIDISGIAPGAVGIFAARTRIDATSIKISGGEHGVLLRDCPARIDGFTASGSRQAALATVGGHVDLRNAQLTGPFRQGGLAALDGSTLEASNIAVSSTGLSGLFAVGAHVDVHSMKVDGARTDKDGDFGHGFSMTRSHATLHDIEVTRAEGAAVYLSGKTSTAEVDGCTADTVVAGAVAVLGATLHVRHLKTIHAAVGLVASGGGRIEVSDSRLQAEIGIVACADSAVQEAGGVVLDSPLPHRACEDAAPKERWRHFLTSKRE